MCEPHTKKDDHRGLEKCGRNRKLHSKPKLVINAGTSKSANCDISFNYKIYLLL